MRTCIASRARGVHAQVLMLMTSGLREVAAMFANPFGKDEVGFPTNEWITDPLDCLLIAS